MKETIYIGLWILSSLLQFGALIFILLTLINMIKENKGRK